MNRSLDNWSNGMTTHIQQNDLLTTQAAQAPIELPRPSLVALVTGAFWAGLLILTSLPMLVAAGLWLLGLGAVLLSYSLLSARRLEAVWDTAIIGQGAGLLGVALLFAATLLG
jgi:hypothetical protein